MTAADISPAEQAAQLMVEARDLLAGGKVAEAGAVLDRVAAIWRDEGNTAEEARCLRLAASLARHEGRLDDAAMRASLAATIAPEGRPQAAAQAEQARVAAAEGDLEGAVAGWERAVAAATDAGGEEAPRVLGSLGEALARAGRGAEAASAFRRANDLLWRSGDERGATQALLAGVTALQTAGDSAASADLAVDAEHAAEATADHEALAQLALLASARALDRRDLAEARRLGERARTESLAARSPLTYVGAAIALAHMADAAGERVEAYASLAAGWATVGDLLGREQARTLFEPALLDLRRKWGDEGFGVVKAEYERRRREATG